jgi:hypothetical protein
MKRAKIPYSYIFILIGGAISIAICYEIYPITNTANLVAFTTTVVGLVISFTAFIIAMKTYLSIDSVNVITQMEGNVLENDSYITSFASLIREYPMSDSESVSTKVFENLKLRFEKNSKTAIDFAANLQYFIDLIVFFPYLFNSDDENQQRNINKMNKLIKLIDSKRDTLLSISTGNLILIEETVKLIKSINNYQTLPHTNERIITSTILDVRGTMLKNSVTQTVYYNYLGLYYNRKANSVLREKFDLENTDFFSIDGLKQIKNKIALLSDEEVELFTLYLHEAKNSFQKALENGKNDVMWEGFIKFNDARSTYLLQLVPTDYQADWQTIINEALVARNRLNILIKDVLENEDRTFLQEAFNFEYYLAGLVKMNILIVENKDITDTFNRLKYQAPNYEDILEDTLMKEPYSGKFNKIKTYQNKIIEYITTVNE